MARSGRTFPFRAHVQNNFRPEVVPTGRAWAIIISLFSIFVGFLI